MSADTADPVVVGVDESVESTAAVRWAAAEAVRRDAPLHLVYAMGAAIDLGPRLGVVAFHDQSHRDAGAAAVAAAAEAAARAVYPQPVDIAGFVDGPAPVPALVRRSREAQLLVVGTRGMVAFERVLLGSVSTALAGRARCPLAVVPAAEVPGLPGLPVLVGVDGSGSDAHALDVAFAEASARATALVAVLVRQSPQRQARPGPPESADALLARNLVGYSEKYPDVPVTRLVRDGDPAPVLVRESADAQLMVLGSRGRRGLAAATLGSVGRAVLHDARIPVMIVA
ncbi:universal stress protein [Nocardia farcinica]|uniref:universal stress protein n=1 Tax=Nocardia farcinica TaxID=37329 RepID=UPI001895824A|nr:universal stress protein [Nocardia farcinica]MBF6249200.1 universal stress protein [Nocardia farcinica]